MLSPELKTDLDSLQKAIEIDSEALLAVSDTMTHKYGRKGYLNMLSYAIKAVNEKYKITPNMYDYPEYKQQRIKNYFGNDKEPLFI